MSTLKELVLKRPQGPGGTNDFLEALLEVTNSDIELVSSILKNYLSTWRLAYVFKCCLSDLGEGSNFTLCEEVVLQTGAFHEDRGETRTRGGRTQLTLGTKSNYV